MFSKIQTNTKQAKPQPKIKPKQMSQMKVINSIPMMNYMPCMMPMPNIMPIKNMLYYNYGQNEQYMDMNGNYMGYNKFYK
jgi:hypothetical protein